MCVNQSFASPACNNPQRIGKHSEKRQIRNTLTEHVLKPDRSLSDGHVPVVRFR